MSESKTYYSNVGALILNVSKGRRVADENGISKMVDQKVAEFQPQRDGYGVLHTSDPDVIAVLDQRMRTATDVFDGREYLRRSVPAEVRLQMLESENGMLKSEKSRVVTENNRLLAQLADEGKITNATVSKK